jgi:hypothetical protein
MFGVLSPYFTAHFIITPLIFYALFGQVCACCNEKWNVKYLHLEKFASRIFFQVAFFLGIFASCSNQVSALKNDVSW